MNPARIKQLKKMTRQQRRDLQEHLVASVACAAYSQEQFTEYRIVGRPSELETHDFDARRKYGKHMLAIEVTGLYAPDADRSILNPEVGSFWNSLQQEVVALLEGTVSGTFILHGGAGQVPNIPGKKRKAWVDEFASAILITASALETGGSQEIGSPPQVADMLLEKIDDQGAHVEIFASPITSGGMPVIQVIEEFLTTTLREKNDGSLSRAKDQGKTTILAVFAHYLVSAFLPMLLDAIRSTRLNGEVPNIDRLYLINTWDSGITTRVVKVF